MDASEIEYEVIRRDGMVEMIVFDDNDDMDVHSLEPEAAALLGAALIDAAVEENNAL